MLLAEALSYLPSNQQLVDLKAILQKKKTEDIKKKQHLFKAHPVISMILRISSEVTLPPNCTSLRPCSKRCGYDSQHFPEAIFYVPQYPLSHRSHDQDADLSIRGKQALETLLHDGVG